MSEDDQTTEVGMNGDLVVLSIDEIKPYENNPRTITDEAVAAVRQSLETYGYQQPIVVDQEHVVIVGHTRRQALIQMGVTEVPVLVARLTEEQAKQYRLVDNRTGEMSTWDFNQLIIELREWETGLLDQYFPDLNLDVVTSDDAAVTQKQVDDAVASIEVTPDNKDVMTTTVTCPSCFHEFAVATATLPGLTRGEFEGLKQGAGTK
jgi:hypothetical protein